MDKKEQLTSIIKATTEVQKYFLKKKDSSESRIQAMKQELFELDIRLDEQGRTRNMYAMNTNSRKNVFSPLWRAIRVEFWQTWAFWRAERRSRTKKMVVFMSCMWYNHLRMGF